MASPQPDDTGPETTEAERVAELHRQADADYAHAQDPRTRAEAAAQLAITRANASAAGH
ncbi:hypothetical protein [Streptomyces sp. NPDC002564]|uniref:hypothetical protein n=1 Tax=Streptomyces sp. NPDC002564 TaxID=3364649 RepID=UPI00368C6412